MNMFRLDGKVALVTGGSYGIGFGIAQAMHEAGATICFNDINQDAVNRGLENYKAAGIPKLNTFLDIAKRKGYTEIVDIIEAELIKRGVAVTTSVSSSTPITTASASTAPVSDVESDIETSANTLEAPKEPEHFSDELVKEPEASVLSDKDREVLIGKAIDALGKPAFYARSFWCSAGGFIGSYSTTWYNSNYNEVKADRAKDKIRDLTYSSDKLIVLRSHFSGGSQNIDRYYSIDIPSSTKYIICGNDCEIYGTGASRYISGRGTYRTAWRYCLRDQLL